LLLSVVALPSSSSSTSVKHLLCVSCRVLLRALASDDDDRLETRSALTPTMSGQKGKVMVQPINVIFKHLQTGNRIQIWLYDNLEARLEGRLRGFDEFMNVVLEDAEEVFVKDSKTHKAGERVSLGKHLLLKGDNITLLQAAK